MELHQTVTNKKSIASFNTLAARLYKVHENYYIYTNFTYYSNSTRSTIICKIHGPFEQSINAHLNGQGCPTCGKVKTVKSQTDSIDDFLKKQKNLNGNRYIINSNTYKSSKSKIVVICRNHGEFSTTPNRLLNNVHCSKCALVTQGRKKSKISKELFKDKLKSIHPKYSTIKTYYKKNNLKVIVTCNVHGDFESLPNNLLNGAGCPKCAENIFRQRYIKEPTILYFIYFKNINLYKIGVTMNRVGVKKRYAGEPEEFEVLHTTVYPTGKEAYEQESKILAEFRKLRYTGPPKLVTGNTELFTHNLLKEHKWKSMNL